MWPFRKTITFARSGILKGMTDCHSHLLPGVDDGVGTLDESLRILDMMEKHGVRKVWLTPHIMEDIPNETVTLQEKFQELKRSYNGTLELALAAEYMMDNLFEERLEKDDLLPLEEGKRYLLVETSYFNPPMELLSVLQRIQKKGYYPLLAHSERYEYAEEGLSGLEGRACLLPTQFALVGRNVRKTCTGKGRSPAESRNVRPYRL